MNAKKSKTLVYICAITFGLVGVCLTFFAGNTSKYDSKIKAYKINANESYDSEDGTTYKPIYYYKVRGEEYQCESKIGSSAYPSEKKRTIYFDSEDPTKCKTEYEKSSGRLGGIVCLIATILIVYFFIIKEPKDNSEVTYSENDIENESQIDPEQVEKIVGAVEKIQLIIKRIIIGIAILILSVITLFDVLLLKQTIKSKNYMETTATYVDEMTEDEDSIFKDYIYTFTDRQGNEQQITVSLSSDLTPDNEITIRYNENDPQDYYEEGNILDKSEMIWFIVKVVAIIILIILFFNKKLLSKVNMSVSSGRN